MSCPLLTVDPSGLREMTSRWMLRRDPCLPLPPALRAQIPGMCRHLSWSLSDALSPEQGQKTWVAAPTSPTMTFGLSPRALFCQWSPRQAPCSWGRPQCTC